MWIDTHCHLDAPEFDADRARMRARARADGVAICVIPAIGVANLGVVRALAHEYGDAYALGLHPLYLQREGDDALEALDVQLTRNRADPRLVAVGEIGLDGFVPELRTGPLRVRQDYFFQEQLRLAKRHRLPVLLHVRRSVDQVLKALRAVGVVGGIAHAFSGSPQQAKVFLDLGLKLGFGGAVTFERATRLRALAACLPAHAIVMETDAPDIPPQWIYRTADERASGVQQGRNQPTELPRIGAVVAQLRGVSTQAWAAATTSNALEALPRLRALVAGPVE